ncbi:MAG: hypothetical protein H7A24_17485 [Leptospiraceae bacterium]|nr:hypothetical protein [Leptospiraceae bacterium]MCP5513686.1 hypothetical protein [Leptospiraceae bacterium]
MPIIGEKEKHIFVNDEFQIPSILNIDTMEQVIKSIEKHGKAFEVYIFNFDKCSRVESSGIKALNVFAEKMAGEGKMIHIINISNSQYKAIKLTGKAESGVYYPHRGFPGGEPKKYLTNC